MPADPALPTTTAFRDDLAAALAARRELGDALEPEVIDAFLARVERTLAARSDTEHAATSRHRRMMDRLTWSLGLGTPLVAVSTTTGAFAAGAVGGIAGLLASLTVVLVANVYPTEVEKVLEKARFSARRR